MFEKSKKVREILSLVGVARACTWYMVWIYLLGPVAKRSSPPALQLTDHALDIMDSTTTGFALELF
jgi:hypothetical protein